MYPVCIYTDGRVYCNYITLYAVDFFSNKEYKMNREWVESDIAHISLFLSTYLFFILNSNVHTTPVYVRTNSFFKHKPLFSNKYIQILTHGLGAERNQQRLKNIYIYYLDLPNHFFFYFFIDLCNNFKCAMLNILTTTTICYLSFIGGNKMQLFLNLFLFLI